MTVETVTVLTDLKVPLPILSGKLGVVVRTNLYIPEGTALTKIVFKFTNRLTVGETGRVDLSTGSNIKEYGSQFFEIANRDKTTDLKYSDYLEYGENELRTDLTFYNLDPTKNAEYLVKKIDMELTYSGAPPQMLSVGVDELFYTPEIITTLQNIMTQFMNSAIGIFILIFIVNMTRYIGGKE
jgi:hypothetical protein